MPFRAAQYYREKIRAEAEGRTYVAPPPSKAASFGSRSGGMTRNSKSFQEGGWDDWGDAGSKAAKVEIAHLSAEINVHVDAASGQVAWV